WGEGLLVKRSKEESAERTKWTAPAESAAALVVSPEPHSSTAISAIAAAPPRPVCTLAPFGSRAVSRDPWLCVPGSRRVCLCRGRACAHALGAPVVGRCCPL